jgi:hypothetical protein
VEISPLQALDAPELQQRLASGHLQLSDIATRTQQA